MPYFERKGVQATCRDVAWDARRHYYSQLVQQVHVLVLGLDVLGNPYGLVSDFTDGFGEFFYEPYMVRERVQPGTEKGFRPIFRLQAQCRTQCLSKHLHFIPSSPTEGR